MKLATCNETTMLIFNANLRENLTKMIGERYYTPFYLYRASWLKLCYFRSGFRMKDVLLDSD